MVEINLKRIRFEPGYWNGSSQPAFIFDIRFAKNMVRKATLERFDLILEELLPSRQPYEHPPMISKHPVLARLANAAVGLLEATGMPVMSGMITAQIRRANNLHWLVGLPAISADIRAPIWAMTWSARLLNSLEAGEGITAEVLRSDIQKTFQRYKRYAPAGVNTLRFLQAAHDGGIPWRHVAKNVYQFGWGSKARWLDSSFTDQTSRISAGLVRDKLVCAEVLRKSGLPVARHKQAVDAEQAVAIATEFGYPVVIKPADLDGGRGVYPGLTTPAAVLKAYANASRLSKRILVEQHIEGKDYRLLVYKGEVFWAGYRRPAYVTGDGTTNVEALIESTNRERQQAKPDPLREHGRAPIIIDDEVHDWLVRQGLTLTSIPAPGQHVRLRGVANTNAGGTREAVLHNAHPENLELACRSARVMHLDLAGIDLLIPDISRSWRDTGAVICEVNSQPQMASHLQGLILPYIVPHKGRIPIVVLAGDLPRHRTIRERIIKEMLRRRIRLGWAEAGHASVGNEILGVSGTDWRAGCQLLLSDPSVDALVWRVPKSLERVDALPVDRVDVVVFLGEPDRMESAPGAPGNDRVGWKKFADVQWNINVEEPLLDVDEFSAELSEHIAKLVISRSGEPERRDVMVQAAN